MNNKNRQLIYYGWLGYHNLGDEALYRAISSIFSSYSYNFIPIQADAFYDFNNEFSPVTIVGGSTGIPDWMACYKPTRYNYVFGAGVKDPSFPGYDYLFSQKLNISVWINRLKIFRRIGVRGSISKKTLAKWGILSEVIGDPSFSLRVSGSIKREENRIAVNIGDDGILWGMNQNRVFKEVAGVIKNLKNEGYDVVLLPFRTNNVEPLLKLANETGVDFFADWFNLDSTMKLIASCKILIGERLHSLGLSAAVQTPFIGLEYAPCCYELAQSVGFEGYTVRTDIISKERIETLFSNLLENYKEMSKLLKNNVEKYRKIQTSFATSIIDDVKQIQESEWCPSKVDRQINKYNWMADVIFSKKPILWYVWNKLWFSHVLKYL